MRESHVQCVRVGRRVNNHFNNYCSGKMLTKRVKNYKINVCAT